MALLKAIHYYCSWHGMSNYYKNRLLHIVDYEEEGTKFKLTMFENRYYFVNRDMITAVPQHIVMTVLNKNKITHTEGPYVFMNHFEKTPDGKYLISMIQYWFCRTPSVQRKIDEIMDRAGQWIKISSSWISLEEKRQAKCDSCKLAKELEKVAKDRDIANMQLEQCEATIKKLLAKGGKV